VAHSLEPLLNFIIVMGRNNQDRNFLQRLVLAAGAHQAVAGAAGHEVIHEQELGWILSQDLEHLENADGINLYDLMTGLAQTTCRKGTGESAVIHNGNQSHGNPLTPSSINEVLIAREEEVTAQFAQRETIPQRSSIRYPCGIRETSQPAFVPIAAPPFARRQ